MIRSTTRLKALWAGCALALLAPLALPAAHAAAPTHRRAEATAFVHELAAGQFAQAEARFDAQMRTHASPAKLKKLWHYMQKQFGPYARTDGSNSMSLRGHPMVIVRTMFKRQTVGLAVFFDDARKIDGLRVVPIR
jgi:hypothetical protein